MNLEPIIQSEVSQKEKRQNSILIIYMEFIKMLTITLYVRRQETQMYRTVFWTPGEGEVGMIWENGTETCILSYVK